MLRTPKSDKKKTRKKPTQLTKVTPISKQLEEQRRKEKLWEMEDQLKVLIRQRDAVVAKLERVKEAIKHSAEDSNPNLKNAHFLKQHSKTVESCYSEYNVFQNQIYGLALTAEQETQHRACYVQFEKLFNAQSMKLSEMIEALVKAEPNAALVPAVPTNIVVPPYIPPLAVPLPTFDGTYENWFSFKCMFQHVMARYQNEAPAIKLYHLRSAFVGKAAGIIDQDIINNNNYEAAWDLLTERCEDKRVIIDKHIDALITLPVITSDNAVELRELIDTCVKNIEALKTHELPVNGLGEQMLVNLLASRMDMETRKAWESEQEAGVLPTYSATIMFLKERCRVLERLVSGGTSKRGVQTQRSATFVISREAKCSLCNHQHELKRCELFRVKSVNEKYSYLRRQGMCFNCLKKGHCAGGCTSSKSCKKCGKRHHTALHTDGVKKQETTRKTLVVDASKPSDVVRGTEKQILLTTAVVQVYGVDGVPHLCRALIDSCFQNHFLTENLATPLALKKKRTDCEISVLNGGTTRIRHQVRTTIKSRVSPFSAELDLLVIPKIIDDMPPEPIDVRNWNLPPNIELADPMFSARGHIDMLLGAEVFWDLIKSGKITLAENLPSLRNTEFGWVVGGVLPNRTHVTARKFCGVVVHGTRESKLFETCYC